MFHNAHKKFWKFVKKMFARTGLFWRILQFLGVIAVILFLPILLPLTIGFYIFWFVCAAISVIFKMMSFPFRNPSNKISQALAVMFIVSGTTFGLSAFITGELRGRYMSDAIIDQLKIGVNSSKQTLKNVKSLCEEEDAINVEIKWFLIIPIPVDIEFNPCGFALDQKEHTQVHKALDAAIATTESFYKIAMMISLEAKKSEKMLWFLMAIFLLFGFIIFFLGNKEQDRSISPIESDKGMSRSSDTEPT